MGMVSDLGVRWEGFKLGVAEVLLESLCDFRVGEACVGVGSYDDFQDWLVVTWGGNHFVGVFVFLFPFLDCFFFFLLAEINNY